MRVFAPSAFRYPVSTGVDFPYGLQDIANDSLARSLLTAQLVVADDPSDQVNAGDRPLSPFTAPQAASLLGMVSGAVISGTWRGIPAAGPVMRVRMTGSGTVSMDSATGDLGAGTVTTAVYAATVAGTQIDDYAYPGDAARSIRFTLTGTAAVEVY